MKAPLDSDRLASALGAERKGAVIAKGGYFGALGLASEVTARLKVPTGGGRPTDSQWTERRSLPLTTATLERLQQLAAKIRTRGGVSVEPMQLAALLLERATQNLADDESEASAFTAEVLAGAG